jgi:hypothetical protein
VQQGRVCCSGRLPRSRGVFIEVCVALLVGWLCEGSEGGVSLSKGVIKGVECYCWVGWSRGSFGSRGVDRFGRRKEGRKEGGWEFGN